MPLRTKKSERSGTESAHFGELWERRVQSLGFSVENLGFTTKNADTWRPEIYGELWHRSAVRKCGSGWFFLGGRFRGRGSASIHPYTYCLCAMHCLSGCMEMITACSRFVC